MKAPNQPISININPHHSCMICHRSQLGLLLCDYAAILSQHRRAMPARLIKVKIEVSSREPPVKIELLTTGLRRPTTVNWPPVPPSDDAGPGAPPSNPGGGRVLGSPPSDVLSTADTEDNVNDTSDGELLEPADSRCRSPKKADSRCRSPKKRASAMQKKPAAKSPSAKAEKNQPTTKKPAAKVRKTQAAAKQKTNPTMPLQSDSSMSSRVE